MLEATTCVGAVKVKKGTTMARVEGNTLLLVKKSLMVFNHTLGQLVRMIQTESSACSPILENIEISITADSEMKVGFSVRDDCHTDGA